MRVLQTLLVFHTNPTAQLRSNKSFLPSGVWPSYVLWATLEQVCSLWTYNSSRRITNTSMTAWKLYFGRFLSKTTQASLELHPLSWTKTVLSRLNINWIYNSVYNSVNTFEKSFKSFSQANTSKAATVNITFYIYDSTCHLLNRSIWVFFCCCVILSQFYIPNPKTLVRIENFKLWMPKLLSRVADAISK